jgi:hypothetical protein
LPYSYVTTTGNGIANTVTVPFPFINRADIHVSINEVPVSDASLVWTSGTTIQLPSTPANGAIIRVSRTTDKEGLSTVYSTPNVLDHRDLNRVLTQLLYTTQEAYDLGIAPLNDLQAAIGNLSSMVNAAAGSADAAQIKLTACLAALTNCLAAQVAAENAAAIAEEVSGIDLSTLMRKDANLSDLVNKPAARTNLGVPAISDIPGSTVRYTAQTLSGAEKTQALTNIGALPITGGVIGGNLQVNGTCTAYGVFYSFGYGGSNSMSINLFNGAGTRYMTYGVGGDYFNFVGAHVYSPAGRLLGTNDASQIVSSLRLVYATAGFLGSGPASASMVLTNTTTADTGDGGATYGTWRYLQMAISGTWYTVGCSIMMTIKNHGLWQRYTPDPWPEGIPSTVMFAKRSTDGLDWYAYNHAEESFGVATVKAVLSHASGKWTVMAASRNVTELFPNEGEAVFEVTTDTGDTDCSEYRGLILSNATLVAMPVDLHAYAKSARWKKEVSPMAFAGQTISMDDRSKSLILGGYVSGIRNPNWTTIWQGTDGEFPVNATAIAAVFDAMTARINACFTTYASVKAGIDGGTITTTEAIDQAFAAVT